MEEGKGHWEGQLERNNTFAKRGVRDEYPMVWKHISHGLETYIPWFGNTYPMVWKYISHGLEIHVPWSGNTYPMVWKMEIRFLHFEAVKQVNHELLNATVVVFINHIYCTVTVYVICSARYCEL